MATERRRAPRFRIRSLAELQFGRVLPLRARGVELGRHGLRCITDDYVEVSSVVTLELQLPDKGNTNTVKAIGLVVWCEERGEKFAVGISFGHLEPEEAARLEAFLEIQPRSTKSNNH